MSNSKAAGGAGGSLAPSKDSLLAEALEIMQHALSLIDQAEGPGDVGAHLDLAIMRFIEFIETGGMDS